MTGLSVTCHPLYITLTVNVYKYLPVFTIGCWCFPLWWTVGDINQLLEGTVSSSSDHYPAACVNIRMSQSLMGDQRSSRDSLLCHRTVSLLADMLQYIDGCATRRHTTQHLQMAVLTLHPWTMKCLFFFFHFQSLYLCCILIFWADLLLKQSHPCIPLENFYPFFSPSTFEYFYAAGPHKKE